MSKLVIYHSNINVQSVFATPVHVKGAMNIGHIGI